MGLIDYIVSGISYEAIPEAEPKKKNSRKTNIHTEYTEDVAGQNMPFIKRANGDVKRASEMELCAYDIQKWGRRYLAYAGAKVYEPTTFEDVKCLLDRIFDNEKMVVDINKLSEFSAQRVIDYLSGSAYVLNINISIIKEGAFYFSPKI